MKLDITLSLILHLIIVLFMVATTPFDIGKKQTFDNVIKVSLTAMPELSFDEPAPIPAPIVPEAIDEAMPEIPIDDPTTLPEAIIPKEEPPKPKDKLKPKPDKPKKKITKPVSGQTENATGTQKEVDAPGTGAGTPFGGVTIDNASFNYPYWFTQAFQKIRRNWRNPIAIDISITCTIYFQVIKSGRLVEVKVVNSSEIIAFDNACILAVQNAAPFPPLPNKFVDEIIGITLPFQYKP